MSDENIYRKLSNFRRIAYYTYMNGERMIIETGRNKRQRQVIGVKITELRKILPTNGEREINYFIHTTRKAYLRKIGKYKYFLIQEEWLNKYISVLRERGVIQ